MAMALAADYRQGLLMDQPPGRHQRMVQTGSGL
jgi:hypothetical protein